MKSVIIIAIAVVFSLVLFNIPSDSFASHDGGISIESNELKQYISENWDFTPINSIDGNGGGRSLLGTILNEDYSSTAISIEEIFEPSNFKIHVEKIEKEIPIILKESISDFSPHTCFKGWSLDQTLQIIYCIVNDRFFIYVMGENDPKPYMKFILNKIDGSNLQISNGGGCLIATATYGSELAPQVQMLREIRDNSLLHTQSGQTFMTGFNQFYYSFSPIIADYERENPVFREMVKITITPMITSLSILNYVDMDSEIEVLGYGISLILLNVMMYVGVPIIVVIRTRSFFRERIS